MAFRCGSDRNKKRIKLSSEHGESEVGSEVSHQRGVELLHLAFDVVLTKDFLTVPELASLSTTNRTTKSAVRMDHIWKPFLHPKRLGFAKFVPDFDPEDKTWWTRNIPPERNHHLCIPPRPRGGKRDDQSYHPHPDDDPARNHPCAPLVLSRVKGLSAWDHPSKIFNQETGALQDLFHPASLDLKKFKDDYWSFDLKERMKTRTESIVYVDRPLPIDCPRCDVRCNTYAELVAHLKTMRHIILTRNRPDCSTRSKYHCSCDCSWDEDEGVEENDSQQGGDKVRFTDPRYDLAFYDLTTFQQVKTLVEYKLMVLSVLRNPLDTPGAWENMADMAYRIMETVSEAPSEYVADDLPMLTPELLAEIAEKRAVEDFERHGIENHWVTSDYCRSCFARTICCDGGWGAKGILDSCWIEGELMSDYSGCPY